MDRNREKNVNIVVNQLIVFGGKQMQIKQIELLF